jgi:CarD family transcriptional regulator
MTMMSTPFQPGEWIVHRQFGIGQIAGIEEKRISGEQAAYCRLDTTDGTIWVPVATLDSDRFRPVATRSELEEAIRVLQSPARAMAARFDERKQRIHAVRSEHCLIETSGLVRDLWVRQIEKSLTIAEQRALRHLVACLLREWALCLSIGVDEAEQQMYGVLRQAHMQ